MKTHNLAAEREPGRARRAFLPTEPRFFSGSCTGRQASTAQLPGSLLPPTPQHAAVRTGTGDPRAGTGLRELGGPEEHRQTRPQTCICSEPVCSLPLLLSPRTNHCSRGRCRVRRMPLHKSAPSKTSHSRATGTTRHGAQGTAHVPPPPPVPRQPEPQPPQGLLGGGRHWLSSTDSTGVFSQGGFQRSLEILSFVQGGSA